MTTEEENFQCWLEKNWDRPLSDEVERLQDEVKRLEIMHEADIRRLQWVIRMAELAPQSVPSVPGVGGFTALVHEQLLRNESCAQLACAFIASEASAKLKEDARRIPAKDLKEVNSICNEKAALGANTVQASR